MSDLAHLKIWDDPAIRNSLSWYLDVAENRRPAKFRIAAPLSHRSTLWHPMRKCSGPSSSA
jgi:hypothetical protein